MENLIKEAQLELQAEEAVNAIIIKKAEESKETYPISRILTNPVAWAGYGAGMGALSGIGSSKLKSRALAGALLGGIIGGAYNYGLSYLGRWQNARALKGRINTGKGLIGWEKRNVKLDSPQGAETYPISRTLTSIPFNAATVGVTSGVAGAVVAAAASKAKNRLINALALGTTLGAAGAGLGAGTTWLHRWLYARSLMGRKNLPDKSHDSLIGWEKRNL